MWIVGTCLSCGGVPLGRETMCPECMQASRVAARQTERECRQKEYEARWAAVDRGTPMENVCNRHMVVQFKSSTQPIFETLGELESGDGFELGGIYYAKSSGPTFSSRGSNIRAMKVVRLDNFDTHQMSEDTKVKLVSIRISVQEMEAGEGS